MVTNSGKKTQPAGVLFSAGLDSAVLLAQAAADSRAHPIYVRAGLAWETEEITMAGALLASPPFATAVEPLTILTVDMRDVYPSQHWAVRGAPPGFDTPDTDVYLDGRNIVLLAKTSVYLARTGVSRLLLGPLAGNPFPDATPEFFAAMGRALSLGLDSRIDIETPLVTMHKADVIRLGASMGVPFERTLSCMEPRDGLHCGRCSKCRERRDGFLEAGIADPTRYRERPIR
jgi:7-cyano-7-deazaguanine synthase